MMLFWGESILRSIYFGNTILGILFWEYYFGNTILGILFWEYISGIQYLHKTVSKIDSKSTIL
jgi:hypothetical protein